MFQSDDVSATETLGEHMLYLALKNEFDELATKLVTLGADPGLGILDKQELHVYGKRSSNRSFGLALRRKALSSAIRMLPAAFLSAPGTTLYASLCITEAAMREERRVTVVDPPKVRPCCTLDLPSPESLPTALTQAILSECRRARSKGSLSRAS